MSFEYDIYLREHKGAVADGFYWMRDNIPEVLRDPEKYHYEHQICFAHVGFLAGLDNRHGHIGGCALHIRRAGRGHGE